MPVAIASLICPNQNCQHPNPEAHRFCQMCCTPLLKRYLWAVGDALQSIQPDTLIHGRFLIKSAHVVVDTQPHYLHRQQPWSSVTEGALVLARPYLKLFSWRRHIPQPYTVLSLGDQPFEQRLLLLEQAPISPCDFSFDWEMATASEAMVLPLEQAWSRAGALRQLNWLWQLAQLWQPLVEQRVASSLLQPGLLRVEGSFVRLVELCSDQDWIPKLSALGYLWKQWLPGTQVTLRPFLSRLCQHLIEGRVETIADLLHQLDVELQLVSKTQALRWALNTQTDQGPTRARNEDACYPSEAKPFTGFPLTIVCDGMGGHADGDVASNLVIQTVSQRLQPIVIETVEPTETNSIIDDVMSAIYDANDVVSAQNDQQQRRDYERMGTTLVLAFIKAPKLYLAHVGDSRAYWITRSGCYLLTTDHNLLSQWVKMGCGFYQEMCQSSEGAKLLQAVGFSRSVALQPDVQTLVIDEDCVILLCSDGLSDHQLVENCWQTEILPILQGDRDLAVASRRLIDLANHRNGRDNVTVSLLHCTVA